jgi:multiple sugar transport system substrate-binding protein
MMRKSVLTKFAAFALVSLIVAACATPAAPAPQAATTAPQQEQATAAPAAPAAGTELTMWTWKLFHVPALEQIAKNYEDKTGVKVKVSAFNPDEVYRTKITTAAQSGDLPDILSYWSGGQWELAATDQLLELTDVVDPAWASNFLAGTYDKTSIMPQGRPQVHIQEHQGRAVVQRAVPGRAGLLCLRQQGDHEGSRP